MSINFTYQGIDVSVDNPREAKNLLDELSEFQKTEKKNKKATKVNNTDNNSKTKKKLRKNRKKRSHTFWTIKEMEIIIRYADYMPNKFIKILNNRTTSSVYSLRSILNNPKKYLLNNNGTVKEEGNRIIYLIKEVHKKDNGIDILEKYPELKVILNNGLKVKELKVAKQTIPEREYLPQL